MNRTDFESPPDEPLADIALEFSEAAVERFGLEQLQRLDGELRGLIYQDKAGGMFIAESLCRAKRWASASYQDAWAEVMVSWARFREGVPIRGVGPDIELWRLAVDALTRCGDAEAVRPLHDLLIEPSYSDEHRDQVVRALTAHRHDSPMIRRQALDAARSRRSYGSLLRLAAYADTALVSTAAELFVEMMTNHDPHRAQGTLFALVDTTFELRKTLLSEFLVEVQRFDPTTAEWLVRALHDYAKERWVRESSVSLIHDALRRFSSTKTVRAST